MYCVTLVAGCVHSPSALEGDLTHYCAIPLWNRSPPRAGCKEHVYTVDNRLITGLYVSHLHRHHSCILCFCVEIMCTSSSRPVRLVVLTTMAQNATVFIWHVAFSNVSHCHCGDTVSIVHLKKAGVGLGGFSGSCNEVFVTDGWCLWLMAGVCGWWRVFVWVE